MGPAFHIVILTIILSLFVQPLPLSAHSTQPLSLTNVSHVGVGPNPGANGFRSVIERPPVDLEVILSSTAELQCRLRNDASFGVKTHWTLNGRNVTMSGRVQVMADGTLRIEQARHTDVGLYTCEVEWFGGSERRSARLDVIELPHPPTNVRAQLNANGRLVNVSWSPPYDGNSPIVRYVVRMRTMFPTNPNNVDNDAIYGVHSWTTYLANVSAAHNFIILPNLRPALTYQFRIIAVNNVGAGQASAATWPPLSLPAQPPSAAPMGVVGAPVTSTVIMIQWQSPFPDTHNEHLKGYMVRYRLAGGADHTQWYYRNVTNSAQHHYLLDDLIVWHNYQIEVAVYNRMGVGPYSQSIYVRTKKDKPTGQVRQLTAQAIDSKSIHVEWHSPDPQLLNGMNQGYKVQVWTAINATTGPYNQLFKESLQPPSTFPERASQVAVMDGLQPYTTYYVTVLCFTDAGDGPKTDTPVIVTTLQDLPDKVSELKFQDIMDSSIHVMWSPPERINGKLLAYTLRYYAVGSNDGHKMVINLTAHQNETTVTNLRPQTNYTFEINAWTEVGAGAIESSTIQSNVLPPVLAGQPASHLAISNIGGAFTVDFQFSPGFNGNGNKLIVESQYIKHQNNVNWVVIYESTNHTQTNAMVVHNLIPYTEYRLRLIP